MSAFTKTYENNTYVATSLFAELNDALRLVDADREIGAIVITGSQRAFAGACYEHTALLPTRNCIETRTLVLMRVPTLKR